jgi:N-acetylmuramic acid 6-phosphate (MurNAc-6-P) etherase
MRVTNCIGAGTSGRLGVLDASECLPTYNSEQVRDKKSCSNHAFTAPVLSVRGPHGRRG